MSDKTIDCISQIGDKINKLANILDSICKRYQKCSITLSSFCAPFYTVAKHSPETANVLNRDAIIVETSVFQDKISKHLRSQLHYLSVNELQLVGRFQVNGKALIYEHSTMSLVHNPLHMFNIMYIYIWNYFESQSILAATKTIKRLFSTCCHVPTDNRVRLLPASVWGAVSFSTPAKGFTQHQPRWSYKFSKMINKKCRFRLISSN